MAKYSTRQRDILLSYLEAHADEQMSIQRSHLIWKNRKLVQVQFIEIFLIWKKKNG